MSGEVLAYALGRFRLRSLVPLVKTRDLGMTPLEHKDG
jgi:hypothetical protein